MNFKATILFSLICLTISTVTSQEDTNWDKRVQTGPNFVKNWSFGAGINIVDDSGKEGKYIGDDWNISSPFALSAEYHLNNAFGFSALFTMNKFEEGKKIDSNFIVEGFEADYFAADLAVKFYLRNWFRTPVLDPYIFVGGGYTVIGEYRVSSGNNGFNSETDDLDENGNLMVPEIGRFTFNTGFGMNVWISDHWGVMGAATGKFGLESGDYKRGSNSISNQIQYTMGILYLLKE